MEELKVDPTRKDLTNFEVLKAIDIYDTAEFLFHMQRSDLKSIRGWGAWLREKATYKESSW